MSTLWAWGSNTSGQLGDATSSSKSSPIQVGSLSTWSNISAGQQHGLGVKADGTLWAWGSGSQGRLGSGSTTGVSSPIQIGTLTDWSTVSCGTQHSLAIKTDGTLWAWGHDGYGKLGDGSTTAKSSPIQIGTLTDWSKISASAYHSAFIKTDGTLWACGYNNCGQLGQGNTTNRSSPVQIGTLTTWAQVGALTNSATIAIKTDGTLWVWGYNANGQLGIGNTTQKTSPVQVGTLTTWAKLAAGNSCWIATKTDGTLWGAGYNSQGQLGTTNVGFNISSPVQIGTATDWNNISMGSQHIVGTKTDGTLWTCGYNTSGQIGNSTRTATSSPIQVGALTNWVSSYASKGGDSVLALQSVAVVTNNFYSIMCG